MNINEIETLVSAHPDGVLALGGAATVLASVVIFELGSVIFKFRRRIEVLRSALHIARLRYNENYDLVCKAAYAHQEIEQLRAELASAVVRSGQWIAELSEMTEERDAIRDERDGLRADIEVLTVNALSLARRLSRPKKKGGKRGEPAPVAVAAE